MNKSLLFLLGALFTVGAGCSTTVPPAASSSTSRAPSSVAATVSIEDFSVNDFSLPTSAATNPPRGSAGERQLFTATSTDGIHFTATGTRLTHQGNVPDAIVTSDGTVFLYYIGQGIETGKETTAVAVSQDNGATWTYQFLTYKNWPSTRPPSDPDVVIRDDGTIRMYFTDNVPQKSQTLGISYADSTDGITFTYKGHALASAISVIDSTTMLVDGVWHMIVIDADPSKPSQYHATSLDGATFTLSASTPISLNRSGYFLSNPLIENSIWRMFGFSLMSEKNIRSFTSVDPSTWTASDVALDASPTATDGSGYLQDSTVAKLADGTYLMVYVSGYAK